MAVGYLALTLHAHLPFVRHPERPRFMEEDWLFEAATETYLPLLELFEALERGGVPFRLTMSLTPPLIEMLTDPLLQSRYARYLDQRIELAENEMKRLRGSRELYPLAEMHYELFARSKSRFNNDYGRDLVQAFRRLQDAGFLEIVTCGATHGFLPLMESRTLRRAQIQIAAEHYEEHFGRPPAGIWLPECAYVPGIEELLADAGIRFFYLEAHGVLNAKPAPVYGLYAPLTTPAGPAAFARDLETARQVWSREGGYPGHPDYREFYRDIGFDLPQEKIQRYLHDPAVRHMTGIKYYRITGKTDDKATYHPGWARERAAEHAEHFLRMRIEQIERAAPNMDRPPLIVSNYDAELFGHWWFEGPQFLEFLLRKIHFDQDCVRLVTPSGYLDAHPENQTAEPALSSWGKNGYFEVWANETNDWIYPHLRKAGERMEALASRFAAPTRLQRRALNQAARELLLAQSSDWAFIMTMETTVEYAVQRVRTHIARFTKLYEDLCGGEIDKAWLREVEKRDCLFQNLSYEQFRP